jgi:hypothetical protein
MRSGSRTLILQNNNGAYEETVHLGWKAKALVLRLGLDNERSATIDRLRREHKIKRNFIALAPLGRARLRGGTTSRHGRRRLIVRDSQRSKEHGSFHNFLARDESSPFQES